VPDNVLVHALILRLAMHQKWKIIIIFSIIFYTLLGEGGPLCTWKETVYPWVMQKWDPIYTLVM
jgi:hypothetical protein